MQAVKAGSFQCYFLCRRKSRPLRRYSRELLIGFYIYFLLYNLRRFVLSFVFIVFRISFGLFVPAKTLAVAKQTVGGQSASCSQCQRGDLQPEIYSPKL